ncbi:hypothetical protein HDU83_007295 [Entophlyctis luteolus]|nr:hypothetical protein HDU83_007295 [Entophlyctis luteolus]KAJ3378332.1 hypothetical protein HDU84_007645 [Entophlyctis sp. JEL0112]
MPTDLSPWTLQLHQPQFQHRPPSVPLPPPSTVLDGDRPVLEPRDCIDGALSALDAVVAASAPATRSVTQAASDSIQSALTPSACLPEEYAARHASVTHLRHTLMQMSATCTPSRGSMSQSFVARRTVRSIHALVCAIRACRDPLLDSHVEFETALTAVDRVRWDVCTKFTLNAIVSGLEESINYFRYHQSHDDHRRLSEFNSASAPNVLPASHFSLLPLLTDLHSSVTSKGLVDFDAIFLLAVKADFLQKTEPENSAAIASLSWGLEWLLECIESGVWEALENALDTLAFSFNKLAAALLQPRKNSTQKDTDAPPLVTRDRSFSATLNQLGEKVIVRRGSRRAVREDSGMFRIDSAIVVSNSAINSSNGPIAPVGDMAGVRMTKSGRSKRTSVLAMK